jgi:hypothetical protein
MKSKSGVNVSWRHALTASNFAPPYDLDETTWQPYFGVWPTESASDVLTSTHRSAQSLKTTS